MKIFNLNEIGFGLMMIGFLLSIIGIFCMSVYANKEDESPSLLDGYVEVRGIVDFDYGDIVKLPQEQFDEFPFAIENIWFVRDYSVYGLLFVSNLGDSLVIASADKSECIKLKKKT